MFNKIGNIEYSSDQAAIGFIRLTFTIDFIRIGEGNLWKFIVTLME